MVTQQTIKQTCKSSLALWNPSEFPLKFTVIHCRIIPFVLE